MSVSDRVSRNLRLARPLLQQGTEPANRVALRFLFSTLVGLEEIALLAAERGDGIPGQVEDEKVHLETFCTLSKWFGGTAEPPRAVQELKAFITDLEGPTSLAVLNIVAETWLENVFRAVASWGIASDLFNAIADEEKRHSHEALTLARPAGEEVEPYIRELERHLYSITVDPYFMYPLTYLGGVQAMAKMGKAIARDHRAALKALDVRATVGLREMVRCGADAENDLEPALIDQSPWEASAWHVGLQGPIVAYVDIPYEGNHDAAEVEAQLVKGVASVLHRYPRLNRTFSEAKRELYQCSQVVVGIRRLYDELGSVITLHVRNPQDYAVPSLVRSISWKNIRQRMVPYPITPDLSTLAEILPRPRAAATVVNMQRSGIPVGRATLASWEGASICVGLASIEDLPVKGWLGLTRWRPHLRVSIAMDHRVQNGRELGLMCQGLKDYFERREEEKP